MDEFEGHERHVHAGPRPARATQRSVLQWSLVANGTLLVAEVIGGIVFSSLALLADAAHMASDVVALTVALVAQHLLGRPASERHTYGLQRADVLGALLNGLLLLALGAYIVVEAIRRIDAPGDVHGAGLLVVASLGLVVNIGSAIALHRHAGENLNLRGAYLHMLLDAIGSVGALVAGAFVIAGIDRADPVVSIAIAILVAYSSVKLIRDAVHVLLEGSPRGLEVKDVSAALASEKGVEDVHHLHMWSIASDVPALSAHIVLEGDMSLHDAQERGDRLRSMLAERFGIEHATLELECHACDD